MESPGHDDSPSPKTPPAGISLARRIVGGLLLLVLSILVLHFGLGHLQVFRISSGSMLPTLHVGDFILVDARHPRLAPRGSIVALEDPLMRGERLCKRLIGLPGDHLEFRRGLLYLNGESFDEPYIVHPRAPITDPVTRRLIARADYRLGNDEFFVLGDNRAQSMDSTDFGPVPGDSLIGTARWIYWPLERFGPLRIPETEQIDFPPASNRD